MNNFYLIANSSKDGTVQMARRIAGYLTERGAVCTGSPQRRKKRPGSTGYTDISHIPPNTECIITLGGDGTLIQAARDLVELQIPLIGINMGTLGYLTQANREEAISPVLDALLNDHFRLEKRMMLEGCVLGAHGDARQTIKTARKLDTTNEITLLYMHELTKKGKKKTKEEKKKEEAVEYNLGNETIIQPKHSKLKQVTGQLAVANIFIGAAIGAAIIWFLVAPAVNQSRSERMNDQMREYADEIKSLEAQVSAQTRTLDNYRASGEDAQANAQLAQTTADSYEKLLSIDAQYASGSYVDSDLADLLLEISRNTLKQTGQTKYDELTAAVYPEACDAKFAAGKEALNAGDYASAVDALSKVVRMNEGYYDGQALLYLAQAYKGNGDNENASAYFKKVTETYAGSEYAAEAQTGLDEISQASGGAQE